MTIRPDKHGWSSETDIFNMFSGNWIFTFWCKFPEGQLKKSSLILAMACCLLGIKPLTKPMMTYSTDTQWNLHEDHQGINPSGPEENNPGELGVCPYCCPGSLCHQVISNHGMDYIDKRALVFHQYGFNSLAPDKRDLTQISKFQSHFNDKHLFYFLWNCYQVNDKTPHWSLVNIGSGNGLVPSGNKPLPEPMLT